MTENCQFSVVRRHFFRRDGKRLQFSNEEEEDNSSGGCSCEEEEEGIVEANDYIKEMLTFLSFTERFQLIKDEWLGSALNLYNVKDVLTLMAFYKFLFLFVTREDLNF